LPRLVRHGNDLRRLARHFGHQDKKSNHAIDGAKSADGATSTLFVVLPQGVYLADNVTGKINEKTSLKFIWQKCSNNGCQASVAPDKSAVSAMKRTINLKSDSR
jgi:invasion protein IalB